MRVLRGGPDYRYARNMHKSFGLHLGAGLMVTGAAKFNFEGDLGAFQCAEPRCRRLNSDIQPPRTQLHSLIERVVSGLETSIRNGEGTHKLHAIR